MPKTAMEEAGMPAQTRLAPIAKPDADARTMDVIWTAGASVRRRRRTYSDGVQVYDEELVVSDKAIDLARMKAGAPVLDSHSAWSTRSQIAVVDDVWLSDGKAYARIKFPSEGVDEQSDRVFALASEGIIRNISVGYSIDKVRVVEPKEEAGVTRWVVERWTPHEISFVTIPADPDAQVQGQRSAVDLFPIEFLNRASAPLEEISTMPKPTDQPNTGPNEVERENIDGDRQETRSNNTPLAAHAENVATQTISWTASDIRKIGEAARLFGLDERAGIDVLERADNVDHARDLLQAEAVKAQEREAPRQTPHVRVLVDEGDTRREAVECAVLHRATPSEVTLTDAAREFRGMKLMEIGRSYIEDTQGVRLRGMSSQELAGVLLGLSSRAGMMSTSDFPNLLANVVSKRLRDTYGAAEQGWRKFCRQSNAPDFKEKAVMQLAGIPELRKIREGQEYTYATLSESVEKYALATYGRKIAITRQTLINDDMGAFDRLPSLFGRAAAELENDVVWGIFTSNPVMGDGKPLFHADHGNLAGSGGDVSETTIEAAEIAMGAHLDAAKKPLNLSPRFIAITQKRRVATMKLLGSITAAKSGDVNVYQGAFEPVVENRLKPEAGTQPWFMITDPARWDTIEYSYLEGEEGLYTEERIGFDVDGIEIKGRLDFAAKAIDWRGLWKNPGN